MSVKDQAVPSGEEIKKQTMSKTVGEIQTFPGKISGYEIVGNLGSGTYGSAFEVRIKEESRVTYALKVQDRVSTEEDDSEGLSKLALVEVDFMKRVFHP